MKQDKNKILKDLTLICIVVATFFLPIKTSISNIGLIGLVVTTLLSFVLHGFQLKGKLIYFFLFSPMVFFIPLLWGVTYSPLKQEAFQEISKYIFLGLTPLFLFRKDIPPKLFRNFAAYGLLAGAFISALALIAINIYHYSQSDYPLHWLLNHTFTNFNFTKPLPDMHPIYMGMYMAMALSILLFSKIKIPRLLKFLGFLVFSLCIVFLASRIIYGVYALLILLYLIHNLSFKTFAALITAAVILLAFSFSLLQKTYIYHKTVDGTFWELQDNIGTYNTDNTYKVDSRFSRWKVALELIQDKPILGYGGGTENEVLIEQYTQYNMSNSLERGYNAHNQYIGYVLRFGIFSVLLLLLYFFKNGVSAFKHQNLLFLCFLTILFWCFMVENILDRNMGINFVALFGTLFYAEFLAKADKKETHEKVA
ncbi:O-antigen ligase family protein [uncultured Mesonia sp.]|uniref:O-antigen ligase family protein n=1 Tax=uncultured Mesonia sp. TaxID=399731 RepID=UPI00374FD4B0